MERLFESLCDFREDVFRNIVSLRETVDLFDDLNDGDDQSSAVAYEAEMTVKEDMPPGIISRGFHYNAAIGYPFESQPFMRTRYGDGRFGVWYGSRSMAATIHETAYHMLRRARAIEGVTETIFRERAVYKIFCQALLLDLSSKGADYPQLLENDYTFTEQIGSRVQREGHPGLLVPSARLQGGINVVAFKPEIFSNVRNHCYLTYELNPVSGQLFVSRKEGDRILMLYADQLSPTSQAAYPLNFS